MKKNRQSKLVFLATLSVAAILVTAIYMKGTYDGRAGKEFSLMKEAIAAQAKTPVSPVKARGGRGTYYPNTEDLAPDEMRIISL